MTLYRLNSGIGFAPLTFFVIFLAACGGGGNSGGSVSTPPVPSAPTIASFTATPNDITAGQSAKLTWQVSGATSLQLNGITATPQTTSGTVIVAPTTTTIYTLTATNVVGTTQNSVTVTVVPASAVASVTINPTATTQTIAPSFLGIGLTMGDTLSMVGTSASNVNPIYEQLLRNMSQYANGPFLIREEADGTSNADVYDAGNLAALEQVHKDLGVQYFVAVDFSDDVVATATAEAADLAAGLPGGALQAIEIGNEPDLYETSGERGAGWNYTEFLSDWQQFASPVAASGGVKLDAPVWAGLSAGFMSNLDSFISTEGAMLGVVTVHHYSGNGCNGNTEPADYLLTEAAVDGDTQPLTGPVGIATYLAAAQTAVIPFRLGELNSVNCGGILGVSNTFSSALWAMDEVFSYVNDGVSGVHFSTPGDPNNVEAYTPFNFTFTESNGIRTYAVRNINPIYSGMLMFAQAVQNGAQLLPVTLATPTGANIKAWATIDSARTIRLLLLNKDETASGPVAIALNGYGQAVVTRLTAPAYSSTSGVTLGGQTFDGSTDGKPQGTAYSETVQPTGSTYTVALPAVSAALITIQP